MVLTVTTKKKAYGIGEIPPVAAGQRGNVLEPLHDQRRHLLGHVIVQHVAGRPYLPLEVGDGLTPVLRNILQHVHSVLSRYTYI